MSGRRSDPRRGPDPRYWNASPPMDERIMPSALLLDDGESEAVEELLRSARPNPGGNPGVTGSTGPGKKVLLATATHAAAPTDGNGSGVGGTSPDVITDVYVFPGGPFTSSIAVMVRAPASGAAVANTGGFSITVWVRDPGTNYWGTTAAFSAADKDVMGTGDFNGGELYFQVGNVATPGNLILLIKEQF
jgi:hypothetical protein